MIGLRKLLDQYESHFAKGGKLEKFFPLYEAADFFLFTSGRVTARASHVRDAIDLKRIMILVVYALIPSVYMALYNTGLQENLALAQIESASAEGWRGYIKSDQAAESI